MDEILINCSILGQDVGRVFGVRILKSTLVHELKKAIKKEKEPELDHIAADKLDLWQLRDPLSDDNIVTTLGTIVDGANIPNAKKLKPMEELSYYFFEPVPKMLHLVIQVPPPVLDGGRHSAEAPSKKRKLEYNESKYRAINIPPSQLAMPSNFRNAMDSEHHGREVYIHNRPIDFSSVPLTLISPIFGRLSDDMFSDNKLRSNDFAPARDLANMLSILEKEEKLRKAKFLQWLTETFEDIKNGIITKGNLLPSVALQSPKGKSPVLVADITIDASGRKNYGTDGHVEMGDYVLLITEGKRELGELSADPHWQLMAYFRAYYAQKRCSYKVGESCLPAILVAYYGSCVDLSGVIMHPDGTVQMEALTPALRIDCDWRDDRQRDLLARFVQGLRNAFVGLKAYYESPSSPVPGYRSCKESVSIDRWFPYKNSYTTEDGIEHTFEYKSRLAEGALVFLAKGAHAEGKSNIIVIKFTRTYSKEVHELLAGEGFAPELYAVEDLAGGWKMVVMEYLSGWTMLHAKNHEERQKYKEGLRTAIDLIHGRSFVHGDIRAPNILVSDNDKIKIIDFDHCGKNKVDVYPREWNYMFEDAKEGDVLRKEHDNYMFDRIFDQSKPSTRSFFLHASVN